MEEAHPIQVQPITPKEANNEPVNDDESPLGRSLGIDFNHRGASEMSSVFELRIHTKKKFIAAIVALVLTMLGIGGTIVGTSKT